MLHSRSLEGYNTPTMLACWTVKPNLTAAPPASSYCCGQQIRWRGPPTRACHPPSCRAAASLLPYLAQPSPLLRLCLRWMQRQRQQQGWAPPAAACQVSARQLPHLLLHRAPPLLGLGPWRASWQAQRQYWLPQTAAAVAAQQDWRRLLPPLLLALPASAALAVAPPCRPHLRQLHPEANQTPGHQPLLAAALPAAALPAASFWRRRCCLHPLLLPQLLHLLCEPLPCQGWARNRVKSCQHRDWPPPTAAALATACRLAARLAGVIAAAAAAAGPALPTAPARAAPAAQAPAACCWRPGMATAAQTLLAVAAAAAAAVAVLRLAESLQGAAPAAEAVAAARMPAAAGAAAGRLQSATLLLLVPGQLQLHRPPLLPLPLLLLLWPLLPPQLDLLQFPPPHPRPPPPLLLCAAPPAAVGPAPPAEERLPAWGRRHQRRGAAAPAGEVGRPHGGSRGVQHWQFTAMQGARHARHASPASSRQAASLLAAHLVRGGALGRDESKQPHDQVCQAGIHRRQLSVQLAAGLRHRRLRVRVR